MLLSNFKFDQSVRCFEKCPGIHSGTYNVDNFVKPNANVITKHFHFSISAMTQYNSKKKKNYKIIM